MWQLQAFTFVRWFHIPFSCLVYVRCHMIQLLTMGECCQGHWRWVSAKQRALLGQADQWGQGTHNLDSEHNTTCNGATEQSRWSRSQVLGNKGILDCVFTDWDLTMRRFDTAESTICGVECVAWLVSVRSYHHAHSGPTMKTATINHRIEHLDTVHITWPYYTCLVLKWF